MKINVSSDGLNTREELSLIHNVCLAYCKEYKMPTTAAMYLIYSDEGRQYLLEYMTEQGMRVKVRHHKDGDKTIALVFDIENNDALTMHVLKNHGT